MAVSNSAVNHNRKLRELLGASQLADDDNENFFDLSKTVFNCLHKNIAECKYFDFPILLISLTAIKKHYRFFILT